MLSSHTCKKVALSSHALQESKKEVALADLGYWQKFCFPNELHGLKFKDGLFLREELFLGGD